MSLTCWFCDKDIYGCFGFTLARDVIRLLNGEIVKNPRVICGMCTEKLSIIAEGDEEVEKVNRSST